MNRSISIDRAEVLRYLGYKGQEIDAELSALIDENIKKCRDISKPRYCWKISSLIISDDDVSIPGSALVLRGKDLARHLSGARKIAVMAATLGTSFDAGMKAIQSKSVTSGLIFDACGSEYIEKVCDMAEEEIRSKIQSEGLLTLPRFSPGYGDLNISHQKEILRYLEAERRIGLTCTESCIMLPRKSVTAIIGLTDINKIEESGSLSSGACDICQFRDHCILKKEGRYCGRKRISEE